MGEPAAALAPPLRPLSLCTLAWVSLFFLFSQLLFLWRPVVNLEFAFVEAALSLAGLQAPERIDYYWSVQANPLGYSLLASLLLRGFPWMEPLPLVRFVSVIGGLLILASVANLTRFLPGRRGGDKWALLLVACHPMIWLYTNNATADVLPAGLTMAALACCLHGQTRERWHLPGILLFAVACLVKFHCILLGLGFGLILLWLAFRDPAGRLRHFGWLAGYTLVPLAVLSLYFLWIRQRYGIVFLPEQFKALHTVHASTAQAGMSLLLYVIFLVLFTGPLGLVPFFQERSRRLYAGLPFVLSTFALLLLFSIGVPAGGEMNFGGMESLVPLQAVWLVHAAAIVMACILTRFCFESIGKGGEHGFSALVVAMVVPYLLVLAMSRPAQRYLILILPLVLPCLMHAAWQLSARVSKALIIATAVIYTGLSVTGVYYLNSQGEAARNMAQWIQAQKLEQQTDPGALIAHIGDVFPLQPPAAPRYRLEVWPESVDTEIPPPVHEEPVRLGPLVLKRFVLCSVTPQG